MMIEHSENPRFRRNRPARHVLMCVLGLFVCSTASAADVYTWTDEEGVTHFSDAPPASGKSDTLQVEEIYRPGSGDAFATPEEAPTATETGTGEAAPDPAPSAADELRERIARERAERQAADAEASRRCGLHRQRLEQMEPARRVFYTDDQGESVRMDDDMRIALIDESRDYLAKNCRD